MWQSAQAFYKPFTFTGICTDFCLPEANVSAEKHQVVRPISTHEAMLVMEAIKDSHDIPAEVWSAPSHFELADENTQDLLSWYQKQTEQNPALEVSPLTLNANYAVLRGLVSVDLDVPDTLLVAAFKRWLADQRASTSPQGRKKFTKTLLRRWAANQILPYLDLLYWAALKEVQIPHWLMGDALFPGDAQTDKIDRIRKTTEKSAQQAMSRGCLYGMAAQLGIEAGKILDLAFYCHDINLTTKYKVSVI